MIRKKRMQIEPEGVNAKRKAKTPADRLWLTRRMFLVKGSLVAGFTLLGARLAEEIAPEWTSRHVGDRDLRGFARPVPVYELAG